MSKYILLFLLQNLCITAYGQYKWGLKINGGVSRIYNSFASNNSDPNTVYNIKFAPSGHAGIFYSSQLGNNSLFGLEVLFSQIRGSEKLELDLIDINQNNVGYSRREIYKNISYIGLPIYYAIKIKRVSVSAGMQVSFAISSNGREEGEAKALEEVIQIKNKFKPLNIKSYDFGPRAGIDFRFNKYWSIEGVYYFGINNIIKESALDQKWRVQQATIGIKYNLPTPNQKE
jgi:hypothetical protein